MTRRMLWHVALNNIVATVGITLLLPFIEARATGASWNPVARALWLIAGSFLLGFVAFQLMTLLARWLGKSTVPQFILAVGTIIVTVGAAQVPTVRAARAAGARRVRAQPRSRAPADRRRIRPRRPAVLRRAVRADRRDAASDQFGAVAWIGLAFVVARSLGKAIALYASRGPRTSPASRRARSRSR